jgi:hypothetical protein
MNLVSSAIADGAAVPRRFTCDGENLSPPLITEAFPWDGAYMIRDRDRCLIAHRPHRPALPSRRALKRCRVHRMPSRVRDDRDTPLLGDETAGVIDLMWVRRERTFFENMTGQANHQSEPFPQISLTQKSAGRIGRSRKCTPRRSSLSESSHRVNLRELAPDISISASFGRIVRFFHGNSENNARS